MLTVSYKIEVQSHGKQFISSPELEGVISTLCQNLTAENERRQGQLFTGNYGTGKTTLLLALRNLFNLFQSWVEYEETTPAEPFYARAEEFRYPFLTLDHFLTAAKAPILLLDNLGNEFDDTDPVQSVSVIKNLISLRCDLGLPTFVASVYDIESLGEIYGNRIASIFKCEYDTYEFDWLSHRLP